MLDKIFSSLGVASHSKQIIMVAMMVIVYAGVRFLMDASLNAEATTIEQFATMNDAYIKSVIPKQPTIDTMSVALKLRCDNARQNCINQNGKKCETMECDDVISKYGENNEGFITPLSPFPISNNLYMKNTEGPYALSYDDLPNYEGFETVEVPNMHTPAGADVNKTNHELYGKSVGLLLQGKEDQKQDIKKDKNMEELDALLE